MPMQAEGRRIMLTIQIDQEIIEDRVRSLAIVHGRNPSDIVLGALATSLGAPELLAMLKFPLSFQDVAEYGVAQA